MRTQFSQYCNPSFVILLLLSVDLFYICVTSVLLIFWKLSLSNWHPSYFHYVVNMVDGVNHWRIALSFSSEVADWTLVIFKCLAGMYLVVMSRSFFARFWLWLWDCAEPPCIVGNHQNYFPINRSHATDIIGYLYIHTSTYHYSN